MIWIHWIHQNTTYKKSESDNLKLHGSAWIEPRASPCLPKTCIKGEAPPICMGKRQDCHLCRISLCSVQHCFFVQSESCPLMCFGYTADRIKQFLSFNKFEKISRQIKVYEYWISTLYERGKGAGLQYAILRTLYDNTTKYYCL